MSQEVVFGNDVSGSLTVSAQDMPTGRSKQISITNGRGSLSQAEVDCVAHGAEKHQDQDEANKVKVEVKSGMENYCYGSGKYRDVDDANKVKIKDTHSQDNCWDTAKKYRDVDEVNKVKINAKNRLESTPCWTQQPHQGKALGQLGR